MRLSLRPTRAGGTAVFVGASAALRQVQLVGPVAVLVLGPPGGPEIRPTHKDGNRKWAHAMGLFWGPRFGPLSARLRAPEAGRFLSLACVLSSAAEKSWATSGGRLQLLPPLPWAFEGQAWAEGGFARGPKYCWATHPRYHFWVRAAGRKAGPWESGSLRLCVDSRRGQSWTFVGCRRVP